MSDPMLGSVVFGNPGRLPTWPVMRVDRAEARVNGLTAVECQLAAIADRLDRIEGKVSEIGDAVQVIRTAQSWNLPTVCEEHDPWLARAIKEGRR